MTQIFITGSTGLIGSAILSQLVQRHPDFKIAALVRTPEKASSLKSLYPHVELEPVLGTLHDSTLLEKQAGRADVVINNRLLLPLLICNHPWPEKGSRTRQAKEKGNNNTPRYLRHTSGAFIVHQYGDRSTPAPKVYDDIEDLAEIVSLPDERPHRDVEKIVLSAHKTTAGLIHTAIINPPIVYRSNWSIHTTFPLSLPDLIKRFVAQGHCLKLGQGRASFSYVHHADLATVFMRLLDRALLNPGPSANPEDIDNGYFFVDTGFTELKDYIGAIDAALKSRGLIGAEAKEVSGPEEAERFHPYLCPTLCGHMRVRGSRARRYLGWELREDVGCGAGGGGCVG
ncbi:hypothetical protein VTN00DRAFT_6413 [Thermoascus crustaceus]|uniref:uncharacterized protein n=1 Tax=Thermoascus crustaceus TaxID=5088 RepID=UPI00374430E4